MSTPSKIKAACPQCGKEFEADVYMTLNDRHSETIVNELITGQLFLYRCPDCGFEVRLEHDMFYNDTEHNSMVWVVHKNNDKYSETIAELKALELPSDVTTRIVGSMNALREKASCFAAGLDDRVVELCKRYLAGRLLSDKPDFKLVNVFFTYVDKKPLVVFLNGEKGGELSCVLAPDVYKVIAEMFKDDLAEDEPFAEYGPEWAMELFRTKHKD